MTTPTDLSRRVALSLLRPLLTVAGASVLLASALFAQTPTAPPSADSLAAITARGRMLAQYDAAAWHASDVVMALHPSGEEVREYVARQTSAGWVVAFGRLTASRDTFLVAYEATQLSAARPDSFVAIARRPARADTMTYAAPARAVELARTAFGPTARPYNFAVLGTAGGEWLVYAMPAQTRADAWPLGGDTRYVVARDGRTITATRPLHKAILDVVVPAARPDGSTLAGRTHTHVLTEQPEDTDVFHVLVRGLRVPEYIATATMFFRVDTTGTIQALPRK